MIARWCISIFIFTLTLFGVVCQQQVALPNQEIVLQFNDASLSSEYAKGTINVIKKQLEELGAENIQVSTEANGHVNIAYYSPSDAASIKRTLSKASCLALDFTSDSTSEKPSIPSKNSDGIYYNLDVFEIQKVDGHGRSLNGNLVFQLETKSDRFLEPSFHLFCNQIDVRHQNVSVELAYAVRRDIAQAIKDTPYKIPEGRAGPTLS